MEQWKDYLEPVIQLVGTFVAASLVIWQVNSQNKSTLALQKENTKYELKKRLFEEITPALAELSKAASDVSSLWHKINFSTITQQEIIDSGLSPTPLQVEVSHFIDLGSKLHEKALNLMRIIETYEIIHPELKIFQTALNVRLEDFRITQQPLFNKLVRILANRSPDRQQIIYKPIATREELNEIANLYEPYQHAADDFGSLVYDFRIEIQNLLLGELFERKLLPRDPIDPDEIVITTEKEKLEKLEKFFDE